jgi:LCP family protein required for cell wall assembly
MSRRSPQVAAALSFLFPGLGQFVAGHRRRAAAFILPAIAVLMIGLIVVAAPWSPETAGGVAWLVGRLLAPGVLAALLILDLIALAIHLVAVTDAYRLAKRGLAASAHGLRRLVAPVTLTAILGLTVGIHVGLGYVDLETTSAFDSMFGPSDGSVIPEASFEPESPAPSSPGPSPSTGPSPSPTPVPVPKWAQDGRLNILLIGGDAGPGRWSLRTDSMIVLSVDVATGRAALFGIPRNLVNVPLAAESAKAFPNGRFPDFLNALFVYAMDHPAQFPGGDARGYRAVAGAIQELVGVPLDGLVSIDLQGFAQLVDDIGGLWLDVPYPIVDDRYPLEDGSGYVNLKIKAGCQKLDGRTALAFARSRHQDSDYGRMERQQMTLEALRRQLDPLAILPRVPELISNAGEHLWTTIDRGDIAGLVELAARVDASSIQKVTFVPPTYPEYVTKASIARIRTVVRGIFDASAQPTPTPEPSASAATRCGP